MPLLQNAVGPGAANLVEDVLLTQGLLRQHLFETVRQSFSGAPPVPEVTGIFDAPTAAALDWFLRGEIGMSPLESYMSSNSDSLQAAFPSVRNYTPATGGLRLEPMSSSAWIHLTRFTHLPTARGAATTLNEDHFKAAAKRLDCEVAAIKAVAEVESRGSGWLNDGRPKILFEAHIFSKHSWPPRYFDKNLPDISSRKWNKKLYKGGAAEYDRLDKAMAFDRMAALKSASYGRFQIMGFNHNACGHSSVESFVRAMFTSEAHHLDAFVSFLITTNLDKPLRKKQWANFARGYNGPEYAANSYDVLMERAYDKKVAQSLIPI